MPDVTGIDPKVLNGLAAELSDSDLFDNLWTNYSGPIKRSCLVLRVRVNVRHGKAYATLT
jgi:hypothetical protein